MASTATIAAAAEEACVPAGSWSYPQPSVSMPKMCPPQQAQIINFNKLKSETSHSKSLQHKVGVGTGVGPPACGIHRQDVPTPAATTATALLQKCESVIMWAPTMDSSPVQSVHQVVGLVVLLG